MFESAAREVEAGTSSPFDVVAALAALTDDELLKLPQADALAVVELTQAATSALTAIQALAVEAFTRREHERIERGKADAAARGDRSAVTHLADDVVPSMLAPCLHLAPRAASSLLADVRTLVNDLPQTLALARAGRFELFRARLIASEAGLVARDLVGQFDDEMVHPDRRHGRTPLGDLSGPGVRRRAARTALRVDPGSARERARLADRERHVRVSPGAEPGVSTWSATQTSDVSLLAWAAIDGLATTYARADTTLTIGQARADAMTDLILGRATITTTVDLLVPAPSLPLGAASVVPASPQVPASGAAAGPGIDLSLGDRRATSGQTGPDATGSHQPAIDQTGPHETDPHQAGPHQTGPHRSSTSSSGFPVPDDFDEPGCGDPWWQPRAGFVHEDGRRSVAEIVYLDEVRARRWEVERWEHSRRGRWDSRRALEALRRTSAHLSGAPATGSAGPAGPAGPAGTSTPRRRTRARRDRRRAR